MSRDYSPIAIGEALRNLRLLGLENAKLAMKIHKQRKAIKLQAAQIRAYQARHEEDVAKHDRALGELNGAKEQMQRLINSRVRDGGFVVTFKPELPLSSGWAQEAMMKELNKK